VIGDLVAAPGRRDVDLDRDELRLVVEVEPLHVLVLQRDLVLGRQVGGERRETERREQRVLDRPEERARRLGERGQDQLDLHAFEDRARRRG
jgi:hypothetical protein